MASSSRGLRLLNGIKHYVKTNPNRFDANTVLSKIQFESANEGRMCGTFIVDATMCNSGDTLHGGYICSVLDVMGMFGQISNTGGRLAWTTNLNVNFINSAQKGDTIKVTTAPIKAGSSPVMDVELKNDTSGGLVAKATLCFASSKDVKYVKVAKEILHFDVMEN